MDERSALANTDHVVLAGIMSLTSVARSSSRAGLFNVRPAGPVWKLLFASLVGTAAFTNWARKRSSVRLSHRENEAHRALVERLPTLRRDYVPPVWASSSHAQIALYLLRSNFMMLRRWLGLVKVHRKLFTLSDGQDVALDWFGTGPPTDGRPVLMCMHGITGDTNALLSLMETAHSRGIGAMTFNRRGHGSVPLTQPKIHIFGSDDDLHEVVNHVAQTVPQSPLILCGLSAGSALTVRYISQKRFKVSPQVVGAIAVSPAYDTDICIGRATSLYQTLINKMMKGFFLEQHKQVLSSLPGFEQCSSASSAQEFIENAWQLGGYASAEEWSLLENPMRAARERLASPRARDRSFGCPMLVLNAHDDPVSVSQNIIENRPMFLQDPPVLGPPEDDEEEVDVNQTADAKQSMNFADVRILVETQGGSHCAWFEGWLGTGSWMDQLCCDFVDAVCAGKKQ